MEICVLSVGKITTPWIQQGITLFESRIEKYIKYTVIIIPDLRNTKSMAKEILKEEEGKILLQQINSSDLVVLADEKGKEYTSRDFADWLQKRMNSGRKRLIIIIGGAFGFSDKVYSRADYKISLSKMTFTHEMAKLLLSEQLYRALTILKGEPYHHD